MMDQKVSKNIVQFFLNSMVHLMTIVCVCLLKLREKNLLTSSFYIADGDMHLNNTHRTHCCVSVTILVTNARHYITLYPQFISCLLITLNLISGFEFTANS